MSGPLAGLRVLELARILAGPWAGQIFADLGADVVKVERKGAGDDTRGWGPPFVEAVDGGHLGSAYFHSTNRGKRSIELDFESEYGQRIVTKLAARSDVLIENFKVGGLAKFGLDYATLSKVNPRLVYCSVTGFGQDGPYASRAGYDLMAQGMGGIMDITGTPDGEPTRCGVPVADIFTGVYSVIGVLAGIAQRDRTGRGCLVDTALLDSQVGVLSNQALNYLISGKVPQRIGNAHANIVPYQVFPVADGHVIIAVGNDSQFAKLCTVLGAPELAKDPAYLTNADRLGRRAELVAQALRIDEPARAGRPAGRPRSGRRAVRSDQPARPGVRRSPGDPPRHAGQAARATPPRPAKSRACARRSWSTAGRWRANARRPGSASTPRRFCARSGKREAPRPRARRASRPRATPPRARDRATAGRAS